MNEGSLAGENGYAVRTDGARHEQPVRNVGNHGRCQNYTGGGISATLDASYYKGPGARNGKEREFLAEEIDARTYPEQQITSITNRSNPKKGDPAGTITQSCGNDYLCADGGPERKYIVRRLTPLECARLQGYPDDWSEIRHYEDIPDAEQRFWENIRRQHAETYGKAYKPFRTKQQMVNWLNGLRTDSAEYRAFGNSVAIPCVDFVMSGIVDLIRKEELENEKKSDSSKEGEELNAKTSV